MAGSARRIVVEFLGDGKSLSNELGNIESRTKRFGNVLGKVGKTAALGLAAGLAGAGYAAVKFGQAAVEDQVSADLMANAFRNAAGATNEQIKATEDWITKQSLATGIADDELRPALGRIITATKDVGEAQKLTALAMDVSAGSGKSLEAVSTALMKAQNGQVSSLSRLGIKTKDAAGETITMEQAVKRMGETFGGSAAKKAETMQGKMDRLKVVMSETGEAIGYRLLPIAEDLADFFLKHIVPAADDVVGAIKPIAKLGFGKLKDAAGDIKGFFESTKGHALVATSMAAMSTAADGIKSGFQKARGAIDKIRDAIDGVDFANLDAEKIGTMLGDAVRVGIGKLADMGADVAVALAEMFGKVDWVGIGITIGAQVPALVAGLAVGLLNFDLGSLLGGLADHWQAVLIGVVTIAFAPARFVGVIGKLLARIPFVGTFLARAVVWVNELGGKMAKFGGDLLGKFWKGLTAGRMPGAGLVAKILDALRGIPGKVGDFFSTLATRIGVWALDAFEAMGTGARTAIGGVLKFVASIPGKILTGIGNLARLLFPKGTALIEGMANGLKGRIGEVMGWLKALPGRIIGWVGNLGDTLKSAGMALVQGLISGINAMAGELLARARQLASDVASAFKSALGIHSPSRVMHGVGENIMDGLIGGMKSKQGDLKKGLYEVTSTIANSFAVTLGDQLSAARSSLAAFRASRQELASSPIDYGAFRGFRANLFGADTSGAPDAQGNPTAPTGVAALKSFAKAQRLQAETLSSDVTTLVGKGLSEDLIAQLKSQGESGIAQIHTLASASAEEIAQINADMAAAEAANIAAGVAAGAQERADRAAELARMDAQMTTMGTAVSDLSRQVATLIANPVPLELHMTYPNGQVVIQTVRAEERRTGRQYLVR